MNATAKEEETWWEATPDCPLHPSLASFPTLALKVAENLALAASGRMCRKGMGWDFPPGVRVDPRMRCAEHTIDKEGEVKELIDVLNCIVDDLPANRRPASSIAYHCSLRDAYKAYEEPANGTSWSVIKIAHKCLERSWYSTYSELSAFGLTETFEGAWFSTFGELDKIDAYVESANIASA